MPSSITIFYAPVLRAVAGSINELGSDAIREATVKSLGPALTQAERDRILTKGWPRSKGNYFEWALADLVRYKFLSKESHYRITPRGLALLEHIRKNPSLQLDRSILAAFGPGTD
jgi:hypothetical protein